jgi:hypothetical protein
MFCVLGCVYEDDPSGTIGIVLEQVTFNRYLLKQNFVVDFEQVDRALRSVQTVQVKSEDRTPRFLDYVLALSRNRFIIVNDTDKDISHVYPEHYWNQETRVVCFPDGIAQVGAFAIKLEVGYLVMLFGSVDASALHVPLRVSSWVTSFHIEEITRFKDVVQTYLSRMSAPQSAFSDAVCNTERFHVSISEGEGYIPKLGRTVTVKPLDVKPTKLNSKRAWMRKKDKGDENQMSWLQIAPLVIKSYELRETIYGDDGFRR